MTTQNEYNEWFKLMLTKYLSDRDYEITEKSYEGVNYLDAKISHPRDPEKDIIISTHGKELTLYIWEHHEHHDSFEEDDHEQEFLDLCEFIDDIINDKVFFAVGYKDGSITNVTRSYELKELLENRVNKLEIKSWSGDYDQTIENV